jgi:hypothetical protein
MILLWAFEIIPVDGEALPDPKNPQFVDAVIAYVHLYSQQISLIALLFYCRAPAPFRCQFRPRSKNVTRLIRDATIDAQEELH